MIIKEIVIENFRSYYGINKIKFNDGLVIIIGDNGDGKTTFFEALEWLFDTSKQNLDARLISEKKLHELPDFVIETVRVSMVFEHDGEKIVEKSFNFSKDVHGVVQTNNFQFKGFLNENTERIPIQGGVLLDRCFEAAIRKYCLFKGEENLNVFNNPEALSYLIDTFSNISQFDPYYVGDEDKPGFTEFAEIQSRKALEKALRSDKQNSQQESELSTKLINLRRRQSEIKQRLKTNRDNALLYTNRLTEIENSKEASELLKGINERLNSLNDKKNKIEIRIDEEYSIKLLDDMWILSGFSNVFEEFQNKVSTFSLHKRKLEREEDKLKGKQEIAKEISQGIIPLSPNVPDKISMQEMIKDEFCKVCGREAKEGTDEYNFMVNKLNELIASQLPKEKENTKKLFPNNYLKELEQKSNYFEYNQSEVNEILNNIQENLKFNKSRKDDAKVIQDNIEVEEENKKKLLAQNDGLTEEQLQNAYENIRNWWDFKNRADKEIVLLEREDIELDKEISKHQESYNNLAKNSVAAIYSKINTALEKIKIAFKTAKEKNTQDFLQLLEQKANDYLAQLNIDGFFGILRIIRNTDGSARIVLQDKNNTFIENPNQALKTTMYMSLLFAVSDLTGLKRENDYPLIFDAPTSSFSPQKESDFFSIISNISKQCIIFTKSFLTEAGQLDIKKVELHNCSIYRIEKQRPFDEKDLSTIQTKITLIKE
jgi:DNA sulfur modification protein DndD